MAIIASENFDSYANNDDLSGKSGGSGWSSNWATVGTTICSNGQAQSGALSIRKNTAGYSYGERFISGIKDSKITFYVYRVTNINDNFEFLYGGSSNSIRFRVKTATDWNIDLNGVGQSNESGWSNNAWQKIEIAINQTGNSVAVSLNEGVPVSYSYTNSGNNFTFAYAIFPTDTNDEVYVDTISIDDDLTFDRDKGVKNSNFFMFL